MVRPFSFRKFLPLIALVATLAGLVSSDALVPSKINRSIAQSPLANATPTSTPNSETPDSPLEVVLVTEASSGSSATEQNFPSNHFFSLKTLSVGFEQSTSEKPQPSSSLDFNAIQNYATHAAIAAINGSYFVDPAEELQFQRSALLEAMVQTIPQLKGVSDDQISQQIAGFLSQASHSNEEKFVLLSMLSDRLYNNYNDALNPGANNKANNPNHVAVPDGNISQQQLFTAAAVQNPFGGGICNNISQSIAAIGAHLFPDQDVLTITGGTHFGVIFADGKNTRVINGPDEFSTQNQLELFPDNRATVARIDKVEDGKLKEIAVIDTQLGQLLNTAYGLDQPILKTGANINDVFSTVKKVFAQSDEKRKELSITGGVGHLSNSTVSVFVVKYDAFSKKNHFYAGAGVDDQSFFGSVLDYNSAFENVQKNQASVSARAGYDRNLFHYIHPKLQMDFTTGVRAQGMMDVVTPELGTTGAIETVNQFSFHTTNPGTKAFQASGSATLINDLGARDSGGMNGATDSVTFQHVLNMIRDSNLHLNQLVGKVTLLKPITNKINFRGDIFYQGSNIGQSTYVIGGLQLKLPADAKLYVFTGAETSALHGYQTKHSLLYGPEGGKMGLEYQSRAGDRVGVQIQGIGSDAPQISGTAKILIQRRKKKVLPASPEE